MMWNAKTCGGLPLCSVEVEQGLLAVLRMGTPAADVQQGLYLALTGEVKRLVSTMPKEGTSAVPTAAQVLHFWASSHASALLHTTLQIQLQFRGTPS